MTSIYTWSLWLTYSFLVADLTLSPSKIITPRVGIFLKRVVAILVSYEFAAYGLASVQAMGLTLPTMVNANTQTDPKIVCAQNLHRLAVAAEDWSRNHPNEAFRRPSLEELARDAGTSPVCPVGGVYEVVPAGRTLRIVDGPTAVIPAGRMAFRCDHHDAGVIENPYEAERRRHAVTRP